MSPEYKRAWYEKNNVCGLHVEHNLQVIPATDNLRKGNYLV